MGRRHALTGLVVTVGGIALLWCAWLVLRADLTTGTTVAVVVLWLLAAGAVATLAAYVREVERHRGARAQLRSSAKPLPGLVLLWVAGLTALAAFPFMLSESSAAGSTAADRDGAPAGAVDSPGTPTTTSRPVPTRTSPTSPSRGATRTASPTSTSSSTTARTTPRPVTTSTTAATVRPSSATTTAPRQTTSTTSTGPLITITVPPVRTKGH